VDFAATDRGFDGLGGELGLLGGQPGLHLLGLFHQFVEVHGSLSYMLLVISF
jgi:hypothetical protein